ACPQGLSIIGVRREAAPIVGPEALPGGEVIALMEQPGTIANGHLEHAICLRRSCLPPAVVDLGHRGRPPSSIGPPGSGGEAWRQSPSWGCKGRVRLDQHLQERPLLKAPAIQSDPESLLVGLTLHPTGEIIGRVSRRSSDSPSGYSH